MNTHLEVIQSKDGSSTIYNSNLDEHYHSVHGAYQEAMHVFIDAGLHQTKTRNTELRVFEMGMGTGLNAVLSAMESNRLQKAIAYAALEAFPLDDTILGNLNYKEIWGDKGESLFQMIHSSPWKVPIQLFPGFTIQKIDQRFQDFSAENNFDLVYWDAFGPRVQEELWTKAIFEKVYTMCAKDAILVTYSSKGDVRRALLAAGFEVEKIPGPPGKREMLRARKN